jgi:2-oxoglutarate dehydrogenase E1 component
MPSWAVLRLSQLRGPLQRCLPSSSASCLLANNSSNNNNNARHQSTRADSFLSASSSLYIESMLEQYEADPSSVPESWRAYFESCDSSSLPLFNQPTVLVGSHNKAVQHAPSAAILPSDSLGVAHLIRAYQVNGHRSANLDPLGLHANESFPSRPGNARSKSDLDEEEGLAEALTVGFHGFDPSTDMDRELNFKGVHTGGNKGFLEDLTSMPGKVTLRKVVERLKQTYCGTIGVEYMHIGSVDQCNWIRERVEHPSFLECDREKKIHIFERLCFADTFENFLASKFNTSKRFGLDGGEAIIPALKDAIDRASELGAHSFIIGMPHRGRLNVLANVMRKPMTTIFSEFQGTHYDEGKYTKMKEDWGSSGDVKASEQ